MRNNWFKHDEDLEIRRMIFIRKLFVIFMTFGKFKGTMQTNEIMDKNKLQETITPTDRIIRSEINAYYNKFTK